MQKLNAQRKRLLGPTGKAREIKYRNFEDIRMAASAADATHSGTGVVVEHRYVADIVEGARRDRLEVSGVIEETGLAKGDDPDTRRGAHDDETD